MQRQAEFRDVGRFFLIYGHAFVHDNAIQPERLMSDEHKPTHPGIGSAVAEKVQATVRHHSKPLPPFHVVLLDDDEHTYEYVVAMMRDLFAYGRTRGWELARTVDKQGKAVVFTGHRELAELKCEQIHGYGADEHLLISVGPMRAILLPAEMD